MTGRSTDIPSAGHPPVADLDDRACNGVNPEIFFPGSGNVAKAKAICRLCPHEAACLEWALETRQTHGVWGGKSADERKDILRRTT